MKAKIEHKAKREAPNLLSQKKNIDNLLFQLYLIKKKMF